MVNSNKHDSLPVPGPAALAHSQTLEALIAAAIVAGDGWLPFDRYMELALYAPGLGYYSGGSTKFGWRADDGSDFITAPELSPLFAQTLGQAVAQALQASGTRAVMEFGAGTGKLAAGILATLDALGVQCERYTIVELSGELRERQQATLAAACADHPQRLAKLAWLDTLPEHFDGVMLGNELLDAMPVKLYQRRAGVWHERGVTLSAPDSLPVETHEAAADSTAAPPADARLAWSERPIEAPDAALSALLAAVEGDHLAVHQDGVGALGPDARRRHGGRKRNGQHKWLHGFLQRVLRILEQFSIGSTCPSFRGAAPRQKGLAPPAGR